MGDFSAKRRTDLATCLGEMGNFAEFGAYAGGIHQSLGCCPATMAVPARRNLRPNMGLFFN